MVDEWRLNGAINQECLLPLFDAYWGLGVALLVAVLNLRSYHVYTMSYGSGIMAFAARGAVRKCNSLW
ncbi:hypothetical protein JZ751_010812 [Albula glossodonta]|uniref:Uncharacterized protein n=1 Tax=Albula glossodonta TaxID=121402 RepID=A0A8T2N140_9TELE|nr:hypothetical protein JZ751_010812 [Albula glossodonta]